MSEEKKDAPNVLMLPPTMLMIPIAAGILLNWIIGIFVPEEECLEDKFGEDYLTYKYNVKR